jgi:hypothetical protein
MEATSSRSRSLRPASPTIALLAGGIAAGPLYILVGAIEMLTRPGFNPTRHDLSLMSNGDFGWVHISLLIVTGLLVVASSVGMRQALREGRATLWAPLLIGLYGLGLVGAGIFVADPAYGFPPGTPADAHAVSWHGLLHFVSGAVGFVGFIAACFVIARRFSSRHERGWAAFSRVTGAVFAAAFLGIAAGAQQGGLVSTVVILAFTAAVVLGWTWLSAMQLQLTKEVAR